MMENTTPEPAIVKAKKKKKQKNSVNKETHQEAVSLKLDKKAKKAKKVKKGAKIQLTNAEGKHTSVTEPTSVKKQKKLIGIPHFEDATLAGTDRSVECTLILAIGDAARTLAIAGLEVVGRNTFGVYTIKRKIENLRDRPNEKEPLEFTHITEILGLQPKKKFQSMSDLKTLRYGRVMIMANHDPDGAFDKGLFINLLHCGWPSLIQFPFVEAFLPPVVRVIKGDEQFSFSSLPEFEEWKTSTKDFFAYNIKFYKGLGTLTSKEVKECFSDLQNHKISFCYKDTSDDTGIEMAFGKKNAEQRKKLLLESRGSSDQRETWLPSYCVHSKDTAQVSFCDFFHKEWITFNCAASEKFLPNVIDGLRTVHRKVLFTCLKHHAEEEMTVAQLAGSVLQKTAYSDGESILLSAITHMASNYVGSNNINLLVPIGQFGSRLQGGKDAGSPHYIFTKLSALARYIYHPHDDFLLNHRTCNGHEIEPVCYIPIIPMVLVNGAESAGLGLHSLIPSYNPRDIVDNLQRMLAGEDPVPMVPWYNNFRGTIRHFGPGPQFVTFGECALLGENSLEITELPIGTWTCGYKEQVLNQMLRNNEIKDVRDFSTDKTVRYVVTMTEEQLQKAQQNGLHKAFRLISKKTPFWTGFNDKYELKMYDDEISILRDFYAVRLEYYTKRKRYLEGLLQAECLRLCNMERFIEQRSSGELIVDGKTKKVLIQELTGNNYDPDPVSVWKVQQSDHGILEDDQEKAKTFDYLLDMPLYCFTKKRKKEIHLERTKKQEEHDALKMKDPSTLWREDLTELMKKLEEVEASERHSTDVSKEVKVMKTKPSKYGQRVEPVINENPVPGGKQKKRFKKMNGISGKAEGNSQELHVKRKASEDTVSHKIKKKKKKMTNLNGDGGHDE